MDIKYVTLCVVGAELFTWDSLDTFKIDKSKIEYIYNDAPKLEIDKDLYLIKSDELLGAELIKYEGEGRYVSIGKIKEDNLKAFMKL